MTGSWALWATSLTSLFLGIFVYARNREGSLHQAWLRLSVATSLWSASTALLMHASSLGWAGLWAWVAHGALSFIPAFFLRFSLALGEDSISSYRGWSLWNLRIAGVFALLGLTPLLLKGMQSDFVYPFTPAAGPLYGIFVLWFVSLFLTSFWCLWKSYRLQIGYRRNQLRYVIIASLFGFASFLSLVPLAFGISVPAMGQGILVFYVLVSYAIVRWRLMDISIVVKRTLLYAGLYSILVGLFVVVVVFLGQLFFYGPQALDVRVLWMCMVALSLVTALVRPLDAWLTKLTDKLLFQKKYEWQKTLKEASKGMTRVTSMDRLFKLMAHFIGMRVRVAHVGIFQRSSDSFTLKVSRGREKRTPGMALSRDHPVVAWLEEKKEILTWEETQRWLRSEGLFPHRTVLRKTLEEMGRQMQHLGAAVCVPAFSKAKMLGFLVLGEKLSGDPYSQEDLDVLATLANEGAVALENAQLYEQLFQRMNQIEELYQREHRLFIHTAIALAAAVDARDPYTHGHTERCTAYAMIILEELGPLPEMLAVPRFREMLKVAALLHDVGKIGVPDEILCKKGKLSPLEAKKMQEHPVVGAIILQPIKGMEEVAKAVKAHHERFDGSGRGYPDNLRGTEIPFMARIISVADTFDTMTTDRPYRRRLPEEVALKEIEDCSGTQFDPMVVQAFLRAHQKGLFTMRPVEAAEMLG